MRSGKRVGITSQLIDAPADQHLWARIYERDVDDILAFQSDRALAIAPHPNFHVVFEKDNSTVSGLYTAKFARYARRPVTRLRNQIRPRRLPSVFELSCVHTRQPHHSCAAYFWRGRKRTSSSTGLVPRRGREGGSRQCVPPCACAGARQDDRVSKSACRAHS